MQEGAGCVTRFLSVDKPVPRRRFVQVLCPCMPRMCRLGHGFSTCILAASTLASCTSVWATLSGCKAPTMVPAFRFQRLQVSAMPTLQKCMTLSHLFHPPSAEFATQWPLLQIVEIPVDTPAPKVFSYDEEWLAVLRETHDMLALSRRPTRFPTAFNAAPEVSREHRDAVSQALANSGGSEIPADGFVQTVDPTKRGQGSPPTSIPPNPQTMHVLKLLGREWNLGGEANDQKGESWGACDGG